MDNVKHRKRFGVVLFVIVILCTEYFVQPIVNSKTCLINMYNNKRNTSIRYIPDPRKPSDPLDTIRLDCGQLCNTTRKGSPGLFFDHITSSINCGKIFRNKNIDRAHGLLHAPKTIPKNMMIEFTMNNRIPVSKWYWDTELYLGKKAKKPVWSEQLIEDWINMAKQGNLSGTYGTADTNGLRDGLKHAPHIKNGRVMVIGSEIPWVEACVLEAGAREVVTLEYGSIISQHPKVKTIVPFDFRMRYLNNTMGTFDAIVTYSSIEHSGLGRYGDALNPWGDIIAIARAWCVTKIGGSLTIGIPYNHDHEELVFNAHRVYGKIRYPYLTTNWKQLYRGKCGQQIHIFTKSK
ncbi:Hypothetical predicted protein [Mytilus galloprovincialis]|uniref:DUF268 domain-containing protein n=1 Tax=Mytilus galloprovincialis TaxID=29158 RepID=A0A8B6EX96_MYTGA|nr:Hypothetical predicted protein [Mytilus galloprovincialis]